MKYGTLVINTLGLLEGNSVDLKRHTFVILIGYVRRYKVILNINQLKIYEHIFRIQIFFVQYYVIKYFVEWLAKVKFRQHCMSSLNRIRIEK